jgi:site-specific DNA recombinase
MKQATKYVLYARKSTEDSSKQVQSIPDQVKIMKDVARRQGLKIVEVITETYSAKQPYQRPEFTKMLGMIERGEIDGIICWQLNRLSRNPTESGILQQMLQDEKLLCIQTNDRTYRSEDNAIIFSVEAGMSNQFVRDLMKNVRRGMHTKAERGWFPGVPPIGYKNENKIIVPDTERWQHIRKMWDLLLSGTFTVSEISRKAEKEWGLTTYPRRVTGGTPLSISGVYAMFKNPFYAGYVVYGGKTYIGKHEQLVTQEEFERAQTILHRKNATRPPLDQKIENFPYRGLLSCGECGCAITYAKKTKSYKNGLTKDFEYVYCTNRRKDYDCSQKRYTKPDTLTKQIRAELEKYTIMPEFFELAVKYLDEYNELESDNRQELVDAQMSSINALENELRGLQRMLYSGRCSEEFFDAESQVIEAKLLKMRKSFDEQQESNMQWRMTAKKFFNFARYAKEDFESDDDDRKRQVLADLGQNLTIVNNKLVFIPIKYLEPVVKTKKFLEEQLEMVGTYPEQRKKVALDDLFTSWYTRYDLNVRPSVPQTDALSS